MTSKRQWANFKSTPLYDLPSRVHFEFFNYGSLPSSILIRGLITSMLSSVKFSKSFWAVALNTAYYLVNRSPSSALEGNILYHAWGDQKICYSHFESVWVQHFYTFA